MASRTSGSLGRGWWRGVWLVLSSVILQVRAGRELGEGYAGDRRRRRRGGWEVPGWALGAGGEGLLMGPPSAHLGFGARMWVSLGDQSAWA